MAEKMCESCGEFSPVKGERFCKRCRGKVLAKMHARRYFAPRVGYSRFRTADQREDINETKTGSAGNR